MVAAFGGSPNMAAALTSHILAPYPLFLSAGTPQSSGLAQLPKSRRPIPGGPCLGLFLFLASLKPSSVAPWRPRLGLYVRERTWTGNPSLWLQAVPLSERPSLPEPQFSILQNGRNGIYPGVVLEDERVGPEHLAECPAECQW